MTFELSHLFGNRFRRTAPGIDLGGGRLVAPEDLLEGHFRRLASTPARDVVSVQTGPSLSAVIQVAAPSLAPLTQIAEQVAAKLPTLQPATGFRTQLHAALEEEHRRRLLDHDEPAAEPRTWAALLAIVFAALGLASLLLYLMRRRI